MQITDRTKIDARVAGAFRVASEVTDTSFELLARTAARESDLRTDLASSTSSAKGLFQFVDQTWYELVKKEGPSLGLERLAEQITSDGKGGWTVVDPREKAKILSLRTDPLVASVMAGRFTETNTRALTASLGRKPTDGEVYAAHVLGASGAAKLVRMAESEPTTTAALAFPKAAAANSALFYGKNGKPATAAELLAGFARTSDDVASRIAAAHATLPATAPKKLDPMALADLVRAQVAAAVAGEGITGAGGPSAAADRLTRFALTEKSLPGSSREIAPATGARVEGWRAKASSDAFSGLMRSDGDTTTTAAAATAATAVGTVVSPVAPARRVAGGAAGGIPLVDPNQPLRLYADPATPASPAAVAATTLQPIGSRPSRLMTAAATGAPEMPLPMVDGGAVVQPSRIAAAMSAITETPVSVTGSVAPGATRVRTVTIAPVSASSTAAATTATSSAGRPLLPPVPGETADPAAPAVPRIATTSTRSTSRDMRPLDLLGFRRIGAGRV